MGFFHSFENFYCDEHGNPLPLMNPFTYAEEAIPFELSDAQFLKGCGIAPIDDIE